MSYLVKLAMSHFPASKNLLLVSGHLTTLKCEGVISLTHYCSIQLHRQNSTCMDISTTNCAVHTHDADVLPLSVTVHCHLTLLSNILVNGHQGSLNTFTAQSSQAM